MRYSMKYSHLLATIVVLVNGAAAQDLGNKYTKFVPEDPAGNGGVTWSYNGTNWINELSLDAPSDSALGKTVRTCVGSSSEDSTISGVQAWYGAGDDKNGESTQAEAEYCIIGWGQHGCMGDSAHMPYKVKPVGGKQTFRFKIDPLPKAVSIEKGDCPAEDS